MSVYDKYKKVLLKDVNDLDEVMPILACLVAV